MLKLSEVRKKFPFRISTGNCDLRIKDVAENTYGDIIDYDVYLPSIKKNLQRDFCWTDHQKSELILSILKGSHIQPISIIRYRSEPGSYKKITTIKVIDGKQRLSTMCDFYLGKFPVIWNGVEYFMKDLDENAQRTIKLYNIVADVAYEYDYDMISDENKIAWFEQINFAGTPQDIEHLNNLKK